MTIQTTKIVEKKSTKSTSTPKVESKDTKLTTKVLNSFDEAMAVSEQLGNTVKDLEAATKTQTSGIEEVASSIQSIATAIQGVAQNAAKTMDMMKKSEGITEKISTDAEQGMEKMDNMKTIVSESATDVKELAKELDAE